MRAFALFAFAFGLTACRTAPFDHPIDSDGGELPAPVDLAPAPIDLPFPTGDLAASPVGCHGISVCIIGNCASPTDSACIMKCVARGTANAQLLFSETLTCVGSFCSTPDNNRAPRCTQDFNDPPNMPGACARCETNAASVLTGAACQPADDLDCDPVQCQLPEMICLSDEP